MEETSYHHGTDYADTGQWLLAVRLSRSGIRAELTSRLHPDAPPRVLLDRTWGNPEEDLLEKIENAVYDNPSVLDDYAADIIVETSATLFVPNEWTGNDENDPEKFFNEVFSTPESEVMKDEGEDMTAFYFLTTGLKSFLARTFPGARISSHLGRLVASSRRGAPGTVRLHAVIRKSEVDLVLFSGDRLVSASSQPWKESTDIAYRLLNLLDVYKFNGPETEIHIRSNVEEEGEKLARFTKKYFHTVSTTDSL